MISNTFIAARRFSTRATSHRTIKGLPFDVSHKDAKKVLNNSIQFFETIGSSGKMRLRRRYLPIHTATATDVTSYFSGTHQYDKYIPYTTTEYYYNIPLKMMMPRTVTRYSCHTKRIDFSGSTDPIASLDLDGKVYGGVRYSLRDVEKLIKGLKKDNDEEDEEIGVKEVDEINEIRSIDVGDNIIIDDPCFNEDLIVDIYREELNSHEINRVRNYGHSAFAGADRVEIDRCKLYGRTIIHTDLFYYPVYAFEYSINDHRFTKLISGVDGTVVGDGVKDPATFGLFGTVFGGGMGILTWLSGCDPMTTCITSMGVFGCVFGRALLDPWLLDRRNKKSIDKRIEQNREYYDQEDGE